MTANQQNSPDHNHYSTNSNSRTLIPQNIPIKQWYNGGITLFSPITHFGITVGITVRGNWYKGWYKQLLTTLTTLLTFLESIKYTIGSFSFFSLEKIGCREEVNV